MRKKGESLSDYNTERGINHSTLKKWFSFLVCNKDKWLENEKTKKKSNSNNNYVNKFLQCLTTNIYIHVTFSRDGWMQWSDLTHRLIHSYVILVTVTLVLYIIILIVFREDKLIHSFLYNIILLLL